MFDPGVERAAGNTGFDNFRVSELAGFVDVFRGQADISDGRQNIPIRNVYRFTSSCQFAPVNRRITFIRPLAGPKLR